MQQAIAWDADTSFRTSFEFQITGGQGTAGADGLTFVLQNTLAGSGFLGDSGGALGYGGTGAGSLAIEFDTFANSNDVDDNSISILRDGNTAMPLATVAAPVDLNSGDPVFVWIDYDAVTDNLAIYVAATAAQPGSPLLASTIDLATLISGGQAYFGFTAATGGVVNRHAVNSWSYESSTELVSLPTAFVGEVIQAGLNQPTAIDWSNDGRNLYVAEKGGVVRVLRDDVLLTEAVIDIRDHVNGTRDRGLLDIAIHPDLANHPYLYLLYVYDPPEVNANTGLAGPDGIGNRASRLTRVTLDAATNYTTIVAGSSEVILLGSNSTWENYNGFANSTNDFNEPPAGILPDGTNLPDFLAADSESHVIGSVEFGPDGALYVSNGDGASYNQVDPRAVRVQDIDNLSGKILRIDPLTGAGLAGNPFYNGDPQANRSKVYQYGLRNPFRISVGADGQVYVGDVGWTAWEEVNVAGPNANFGWPYYEGGNGVSLRTNGYQNLPEAQDFYASGQTVTAAILGLNHAATGINALVVGDIYTGTVYPSQYQGDLLFNDLGQGIVRNVSFDANGDIANVSTFATGAQVVVQMKTGPDGYVYYVDLDGATGTTGGLVGRWVPEVSGNAASPSNHGGTPGSSGSDGSGGANLGPAEHLAGVTLARRAIRIGDDVAGPLIINLAAGILATDQGYMEIPETVRRITAVGGSTAGDRLHIVGSDGADRVTTRGDRLRLDSLTIRVQTRGFADVAIHGGTGSDSAHLVGSRGNDRLVATPQQASFVGDGFSYRFEAFAAVSALAGRGGQDEAILYDSAGDDLLVADARGLELSGEGFLRTVAGFSETTTYATGGDDVAFWRDHQSSMQHMTGALYVALTSRHVTHELHGAWRLVVASELD